MRAEKNAAGLYHRLMVYLLFLILLLPLAGTLLYSLATSWSASTPCSRVRASAATMRTSSSRCCVR